ncbi:hypothetical protein BJ912DRAFT_1032129 [Pholiota molesta]|nr:hypothetical protein BJ912DRAFT_1032129 [Pholiota molesta]
MLPPTTYLPSIKSIATYPVDTLEDALQYLRLIYSPPVAALLAAEALRNDTFERAYAIKWLSALIAQAALVEAAAALLATCAGTAAAGTLIRQFLFPAPWPAPGPDAPPITVVLTDAPLDNQDYGSVGAQTWGGACVMAEMIVLPTTLRCLELGAGTGLVSLAAGKVVERLARAESAPVHIVATDYYPAVLANLARNAPEPVLERPFDVVYGADIIYEATHATWIKACLATLLRKPTSSSSSSPPTTRRELVMKHKQIIVCEEAESGREEKRSSTLYRIGWGWS